MNLNGTYTPFAEGTRTPMYVGNDMVTANVYDGNQIGVFVGVELVFEGPLPERITSTGDINPFVKDLVKILRPERTCESCQKVYNAAKSDAVTVALFCCYTCERSFSRVRTI